MSRHLDWDGCFNARELGGLPAADGMRTRPGALVRSDSLDNVPARTWTAIVDVGIRTIIDLRNDDEIGKDVAPRPPVLTTLHLPHDKAEDSEFWEVWGTGPQFGTPLYYWPHLQRCPERSVRVLSAIAHAVPGGVLFHCSIGRDRTGFIASLVLHLLGVPVADIVADYEAGTQRLARLFAHRRLVDQESAIDDFLAKRGVTRARVIESMLGEPELMATLARGGLTRADVAALRRRVLASPDL